MANRGGAESRWVRRAAEGVTIVLSILLALAADAAWGYRADRAEETRLLDGLEEEFVEAAAEVYADLQARSNIQNRLTMMAGARQGQPVPLDSVPVLVSALLDWRFYTPGHAVLDDAISSGRFDLIRSTAVRRALVGYDQQRHRVEVFDARERDLVSERIEPYLLEHVALDRLTQDPTLSAEAERFVALLADDPTFAGLVELKRQRTDEAITFSRLVQRQIENVLLSLNPARFGAPGLD